MATNEKLGRRTLAGWQMAISTSTPACSTALSFANMTDVCTHWTWSRCLEYTKPLDHRAAHADAQLQGPGAVARLGVPRVLICRTAHNLKLCSKNHSMKLAIDWPLLSGFRCRSVADCNLSLQAPKHACLEVHACVHARGPHHPRSHWSCGRRTLPQKLKLLAKLHQLRESG